MTQQSNLLIRGLLCVLLAFSFACEGPAGENGENGSPGEAGPAGRKLYIAYLKPSVQLENFIVLVLQLAGQRVDLRGVGDVAALGAGP